MKKLFVRPCQYLLCAALLWSAPDHAYGQQAVSVELQLVPKESRGTLPAQLVVTIVTTGDVKDAKLTVLPPAGFKVASEGETALPNPLRGKAVQTFSLTRTEGPAARESVLRATLTWQQEGTTLVYSSALPLAYRNEISVAAYLGFGILGLMFGYAVRQLATFLKEIEAEKSLSAAQGLAVQSNILKAGILSFIRQNYYYFDLGVIVVLGFVALVLLTTAGHPPEVGATWYGAVATGIGLGTLTNTELGARFRR